MPIKLYLNENMSAEIAQRLREQGYDAVSSHEAGMDALDDEAQISFAVSERRAVVSINKKDFLAIHNQYIENGKIIVL